MASGIQKSKTAGLTSVITGDIKHSRKVKTPKLWLSPLKKILSEAGSSPHAWEVYRGDSFQVEIINPADALQFAIRIKAALKTLKDADVRMAIGIGKKEFTSSRLAESNGQAFIYSGEKLETLKKERTNLAIQTPWTEVDKELNVLIKLGLIAMDHWTRRSAELVALLMSSGDLTQKKLAKKLNITQSSISERMQRSYYSEIMDLEAVYRERITKMIS